MRIPKLPLYVRAIQLLAVSMLISAIFAGSDGQVWGLPKTPFVTVALFLTFGLRFWVSRQQTNLSPSFTKDEDLPPPP